jgi:hypothetical protein
MGNGFVAEEDETERESLGAVGSSSASRKRPLDGKGSAQVSDTDEVAPNSFNDAVQNKYWRDSMSAEIKALKN